MGWMDENTILIFGGFGSTTGNQGINPKHFYDLYTLDLRDKNIKKIREIKGRSTPFAPAANAIITNDKSSFYTLIFNNINYNTHLQLAEIGIDKEEFRVYKDSIPYNFLDTESWAGLFLNSSESKLIAITRTDSLIEIYQQAYPPLLKNEAMQPTKDKSSKSTLLFFVIGITLIVGGIIVYKRYGKKSLIPKPIEDHKITIPVKSTVVIKKKVTSIILMGGFQIFDNKGDDITGLFTPTIKQLFLLIYLSSILDKKGISSELLTELLWSDKSTTSARNNRNVNISKLRLILEKVSSELLLTHDNSFWKIEHDNSVYSDILDSQRLTNKVKSNSVLTNQETERLLENSAKGGICPRLQTDWMDQFKAYYTALLLDALFELLHGTKHHQLIAKISDSILKLDPLNDEALKMKCQALFKLGKKSQALSTYNQFCKDYINLLGQEFDKGFNELIEGAE